MKKKILLGVLFWGGMSLIYYAYNEKNLLLIFIGAFCLFGAGNIFASVKEPYDIRDTIDEIRRASEGKNEK